jgi:hypothetical protein
MCSLSQPQQLDRFLTSTGFASSSDNSLTLICSKLPVCCSSEAAADSDVERDLLVLRHGKWLGLIQQDLATWGVTTLLLSVANMSTVLCGVAVAKYIQIRCICLVATIFLDATSFSQPPSLLSTTNSDLN